MSAKVTKVSESREEIRTFEFDMEFDPRNKSELTYRQMVDWAMQLAESSMDLPKDGRSWSIDYRDRPGWDNTISLSITARR